MQMLGQDLGGLLTGSASDFRVAFSRRQPWSDRLLHEGLYVLKWTGHLLMATGIGLAVYTSMQTPGLVE